LQIKEVSYTVSETVEATGILTAYFYRKNNTSATYCTCKLCIFWDLGLTANLPPLADERIRQMFHDKPE
jgi:hypothetical protein